MGDTTLPFSSPRDCVVVINPVGPLGPLACSPPSSSPTSPSIGRLDLSRVEVNGGGDEHSPPDPARERCYHHHRRYSLKSKNDRLILPGKSSFSSSSLITIATTSPAEIRPTPTYLPYPEKIASGDVSAVVSSLVSFAICPKKRKFVLAFLCVFEQFEIGKEEFFRSLISFKEECGGKEGAKDKEVREKDGVVFIMKEWMRLFKRNYFETDKNFMRHVMGVLSGDPSFVRIMERLQDPPSPSFSVSSPTPFNRPSHSHNPSNPPPFSQFENSFSLSFSSSLPPTHPPPPIGPVKTPSATSSPLPPSPPPKKTPTITHSLSDYAPLSAPSPPSSNIVPPLSSPTYPSIHLFCPQNNDHNSNENNPDILDGNTNTPPSPNPLSSSVPFVSTPLSPPSSPFTTPRSHSALSFQKEEKLFSLFSMSLFDLGGVKEIANKVTYYMWKSYKMISPSELFDGHWQGKKREREAPNIHRIGFIFNQFSSVCAITILSAPEEERSNIMIKVIELAYLFKKMKNFEGMGAVVGVFGQASIQRLKPLWSSLPKKVIAKRRDVERLLNPQNNYGELEKLISHARSEGFPCIPLIAPRLRTLRYLYDSQSKIENRMIDFSFLLKIGGHIHKILLGRGRSYNIQVAEHLADDSLTRVLVTDLNIDFDKMEDTFYERSKRIFQR